MSNTAIKVENLSKIYCLGEIGTGTISRDMDRWFKTRILKQEDPFLKIGETNDRANKGASDIVYSLQDINFEINQGDAVGIIGRNGAGKSTLLKILSRVTTPTTGKINIKGRVASLLEVGTGFHPELTGRENIYLNGAILGMRKREIDRKLDEIIDFSGVERYIDTPVKRYSSGMYVRLAFAVAAHLESEILVVDEVLAVGDAEFQKKCLGKMGEVSKGEGRTVLFVSHNMAAVSNLCNQAIVLNEGKIHGQLDIDKAINIFMNLTSSNKETKAEILRHKLINFQNIRIHQDEGDGDFLFSHKQVIISYIIEIKEALKGLRIGFDLLDNSGILIFRTLHDDLNSPEDFLPGEYELKSLIPKNFLKEGNYQINILAGLHNVEWILENEVSRFFTVSNIYGVNSNYSDFRPGLILPEINWQLTKRK
jgi:lipopolysaccharide transport system ATP-binding protein